MSKQVSNTTTIKQLKELPGMMSCLFEHKVTDTSAKFKWTGPKISPELWSQILAFFKWTYDEHKSESQVRLFVNHRTRQWSAWAFPQRARTGMSAHEITEGEDGYEATKTQRAQFGDHEGWTYFGTVHHHCSSSAFQSGTDRQNEHDQDGLHITIGKMDERRHDIHCRLYISGFSILGLDMSDFWDVEHVLRGLPHVLRNLLADGAEDALAKQQMCIPSPAETEFPEVWKTNVIEVRAMVTQPRGLVYSSYQKGKPYNIAQDVATAAKELLQFCHEEEVKGDPVMLLAEMIEFPFIVELVENCYRNDVSLEALLEYMDQSDVQEELKQNNGVPDYDGGYGGLPE